MLRDDICMNGVSLVPGLRTSKLSSTERTATSMIVAGLPSCACLQSVTDVSV